jgi:lipopolysaccharide/colanic/teichoic acid biosynthesis glycosyltransferase
MHFDGKPSTDLDLAPTRRVAEAVAISPSFPKFYFGLPKRMFDICLAIFLAPLLVPVILALWAAVRADGGPGFFGHTRVGKDGKPFKCYKLRSMVPDAEARLKAYLAANPEAAEQWKRDFKLDNDPRITRLGNVLRKTSLDELPQLWNVLTGEMSFVGPRPVTTPEMMLYGARAGIYKALRPGITGLWQVSGRNSVSYDQRVEMDEVYFRKGSFLMDLKIIFKTAAAVVLRTGQ